jgi:hypothetical protein
MGGVTSAAKARIAPMTRANPKLSLCMRITIAGVAKPHSLMLFTPERETP